MYKICYDVVYIGVTRKILFESKSYAEAIEFYKKNKRKYRLMDRYLYIYKTDRYSYTYKDEFVLDQKTINECFEEGGE